MHGILQSTHVWRKQCMTSSKIQETLAETMVIDIPPWPSSYLIFNAPLPSTPRIRSRIYTNIYLDSEWRISGSDTFDILMRSLCSFRQLLSFIPLPGARRIIISKFPNFLGSSPGVPPKNPVLPDHISVSERLYRLTIVDHNYYTYTCCNIWMGSVLYDNPWL